MENRSHYAHAPITEAIIDLRVRLPESIQIDDLERLHDSFREDYPYKMGRSIARGKFEMGASVSASASGEPVGFLFKSGDEKQICQVRRDAFSLSRLAPYDCWESFRDEARRLWKIYRRDLRPQEIERMAVRYINRIDLPLPLEDLSEYLQTFPQIAGDLPQALSGLFMQLTIPHGDIQSTLILTEALIDPVRTGVASIVLDIDLFRAEEAPSEDDALWDFFEVLHERKNAVFEGCITAKTRELFQ